jgi:hypothetical protein
MPQFNLPQLYDKTFYAKSKVGIYAHPNAQKPYRFIKPGEVVGVLYSYVNKNGIWFMFYDANKKPYYTKSKPGLYSFEAIKAQGAKTVEEERAEKKDAQLYDKSKLEYFIHKYGLWVLGATVAVALIRSHKS